MWRSIREMRPAINQGGRYVARQLLSDEGRGFGSTFTLHSEGISHRSPSGIILPTVEGKLTRTRMACSTLDELLGLGQQQQKKTGQLDPACCRNIRINVGVRISVGNAHG